MKWQFIEHSAFAFTPICCIIGVLPYSPSEQRCEDSAFLSQLQHHLWTSLAVGHSCLCYVPSRCFVVTWLRPPLFCKLTDGCEWCFPALDVSIISTVPHAEYLLNNCWGDEWVGNGWIHSPGLTKFYFYIAGFLAPVRMRYIVRDGSIQILTCPLQ